MGLQPLIEPTLIVEGPGVLTKTKVANFHYVFPESDSEVKEECWRFNATPNAGSSLLWMKARCVIRGMSSLQGQTYNLINDVSKSISNGYTTYWFEPIQGENPDTNNEYWLLTGWGVAPIFGLTNFYNPYTEIFEVTAHFATNLILRDQAQGNAILRSSAAFGNTIQRDA